MGALPGTGDPFLVMESAQQRGLWDRARNLLEQYRHEGAIDDSNYTLSNAQIQWRSDCVNRMKELQEIHTGDDLREILYSEFDSFAADWALDVYKG